MPFNLFITGTPEREIGREREERWEEREREGEKSEGKCGGNGESAPQFDSGHLAATALAQTEPQFPPLLLFLPRSSPLQLPGLARVLAIWRLLFMQDTAPVSGRSHVNLPLASDANAHFYAFTHMSPLFLSLPRLPSTLGIHRVFRISHGSHMPC